METPFKQGLRKGTKSTGKENPRVGGKIPLYDGPPRAMLDG
jgi:hypothetical protein